MEKLEWWGYPIVKNFEDMCKSIDRIPACDGQSDGQTSCHGIVHTMHTRRVVKTGARGRSRSSKMVPFDRSYKTFYWSTIASIALRCTTFELFNVE